MRAGSNSRRRFDVHQLLFPDRSMLVRKALLSVLNVVSENVRTTTIPSAAFRPRTLSFGWLLLLTLITIATQPLSALIHRDEATRIRLWFSSAHMPNTQCMSRRLDGAAHAMQLLSAGLSGLLEW